MIDLKTQNTFIYGPKIYCGMCIGESFTGTYYYSRDETEVTRYGHVRPVMIIPGSIISDEHLAFLEKLSLL